MNVHAFPGEIFQPVPYSQATPQGMPADIEEKYFLNEQVNDETAPRIRGFPSIV